MGEHVTPNSIFDRAFLEHVTNCAQCKVEFSQEEHVKPSDPVHPRGVSHIHGCPDCQEKFPSILTRF